MDCYRYSGLAFGEHSRALEEILRADAVVWAALKAAHALDNRATHAEKGRRARKNWAEVTVVPW